jgi:hypothetical protein
VPAVLRLQISDIIMTFPCRIVIAWCTTILAPSQAAERPAFGAIAPVIDQLRHGTGSNLAVHIDANSFEILQEATTPITSTEARAARAELRKHGFGLPSIRFTKSREVAAYDLDERTVIEVDISATPENWTRRRLEMVATYPDSAWEPFMEFCLRNGLTELSVYEKGAARFGEIAFAAVGPAAIGSPGGSLHLSPAFYEDMRVSPDYPETTGTNGFVILIHDPDQDVGRRFRLMSGLAALFAANPALNFEYLAEGAFPEAERSIRDGGLGDYLRKFPEPQRKLIVNAMLREFLIDTPLAFQLSKSPEAPIHGLAIDDDSFFRKSEATFVEASKIDAALTALREFAAPRDQENSNSEEAAARGMILEGVYMTAALERANPTNLSDAQLVKHLERLRASFGALGDVAAEIAKSLPEMQLPADSLKKQSAAYSTEVQKYKDALQRSETMLGFIEAAGRNCAKQVPLVFIGSQHTEAITRRLRTDGIGYVVIEPRRLAPYNHFDRDQKRFEKGLCSLTEDQVRTDHIPFIQAILREATTHQIGITGVSGMGNINLNRLQLAVASNGWLADSAVENGSVDSAAIDGAFAFFDEADGKPRLVLLDKDSERWRGEDRYARLADATFALPYADKDQTAVLHFVRQPSGKSSHREYYSIYKPDSKRLYLVEGSNSSVASVLGLATVRGRGSVNVQIQLSELLIGAKEVALNALP